MVQAGSTASSDNGGASTHTGRRAPTGSSRAVDRGGVVVPVVTGPGHVAGTLAVPTDHGRLHPLTTDDEPGPSGQPQRRQEQTRARPPPRHVGRYCVLHGGEGHPAVRLAGVPQSLHQQFSVALVQEHPSGYARGQSQAQYDVVGPGPSLLRLGERRQHQGPAQLNLRAGAPSAPHHLPVRQHEPTAAKLPMRQPQQRPAGGRSAAAYIRAPSPSGPAAHGKRDERGREPDNG